MNTKQGIADSKLINYYVKYAYYRRMLKEEAIANLGLLAR